MQDAIYKLIQIQLNEAGEHILSIKVEDTPRTNFEISALKLLTQKNILLPNFSYEDIINREHNKVWGQLTYA